jgi:hypothetical protein
MKPMQPGEDPIQYWGKQLFKSLFRVRVRQKDLYTKAMIAQSGLPTLGDPELDKDMLEAKVVIQITINDMIERVNDGIQIGIIRSEDTKTIYNICYRYLEAWQDHRRDELNRRAPPTDDLMKIDAFAKLLYPHAKPHIEVSGGNKLADFIRSQDLFTPVGKPERRQVPDDHPSFENDIAGAMMAAGKIGRFNRGNR